MAALIEKANGKSPFFVGKPNRLTMHMALCRVNLFHPQGVCIDAAHPAGALLPVGLSTPPEWQAQGSKKGEEHSS